MSDLLLKPYKVGYFVIVLMLVGAGWLELGAPLLTLLFSYFVLTKLHFFRFRWVAIGFFTVIMCVIFYGFVFFVREAFDGLPRIAETSIPMILRFAKDQGMTLPFEDLDTLKALIMDGVKSKVGYLGNFAKLATKEFAYLLIGAVAAASIFINPTLDLDKGRHLIPNNLYSLMSDAIVSRFQSFYLSFARVMGAQLLISLINTACTAMYIVSIGLPYSVMVILLTFLCGLLPIIGNLISNSVIVALSFTISPKLALISLIFLVVLHKLEYFLNSKIIGDRIRNPVWLTLVGLIIGERLMGVPGMILAPVVLNFIKVEASNIEVPPDSGRVVSPVAGSAGQEARR